MTVLHPWWLSFGSECSPSKVQLPRASGFVGFVERSASDVARIIAARRKGEGSEAILVEVQTNRPQKPAVPLLSREMVAILFSSDDRHPPIIVALRPGFPRTSHQFWNSEGVPPSLCVDDRPWPEARLTWTPAETLQRLVRWFERAGMGELHEAGQPLDPYFAGATFQIVLPKAVFDAADEKTEVVAHIRDGKSNVAVATLHRADAPERAGLAISFVCYAPEPLPMAVLRSCPRTLGSLAKEMKGFGVDLFADLSGRAELWAGGASDRSLRFNAPLGILIRVTVLDPGGGPARREDPFVFWTKNTVGQIGVALGRLLFDPNLGFVPRLGGGLFPSALSGFPIEPAIAHVDFTRETAAAMAGRDRPDDRRVVLVGAGAIGSMLAETLVREGRFSWDIVDDDVLLPHNLARHTLSRCEVGIRKAKALAERLAAVADGTVATGYALNVLDSAAQEVAAKVAEADVVVEASASIAAARRVCDLPGAARRVSAFFNPAGTDVVVLVEDAAREIDLRSLEAAYYRAVLTAPELSDHLTKSAGELRYSGSCRAVTNRIPASRAQALSAIAAGAISKALDGDAAYASIWRMIEDGSVVRHGVETAPATRRVAGDWKVLLPASVTTAIVALRRLALPSETGGVVLGVIDVEAKRIDVVDVGQAPPDSRESPIAFERGVAGLQDAVLGAQMKTLDQIRYVGEWHSHPQGVPASPSITDIKQVFWLADTLSDDGFPGLMLIAGDGSVTATVGALTAPGIVEVELERAR